MTGGSPGSRPGDALDATLSPVVLRAVSCPRCAGSVEAAPGSRIIACRHCGTRFLQSSSAGHARRYFPSRVARLTAVGRATGWLLQYEDAPDDIGDSAFSDAHLLYVPIWEVRAYLVGYEFGTKLRTKREVRRVGDQEIVDVSLVDEALEAGFLDERRMYREAVDLRSLGMRRPHVTGSDHTLPLVGDTPEKGAAVLEPQTDAVATVQTARRSFLRPPTGSVSRDARLFLMREQLTLLYYPLWHLRYRYRGRSYEVIVDGRNGEVHAARAPADNRRRVAAMTASFGGLAAGAAVLATAWQEWGLPDTVAFYAAALILVLASTAYWRFELIREVEHHEPFAS